MYVLSKVYISGSVLVEVSAIFFFEIKKGNGGCEDAPLVHFLKVE